MFAFPKMASSSVNKKQGHLVLLTNHYPYGKGEAFLETEVPYLLDNFERLTIITKNTTEPLRPHQPNVQTYRVSAVGTLKEFVKAIFFFLTHPVPACKALFGEIKSVSTRKNLSMATFWVMVHDLFKALEKANQIRRILAREQSGHDLILYSYWLDSTALATIFVKGKGSSVRRIARAHGGDIYEFRHRHSYLSFRSALLQGLHAVFTVSDNGNDYLTRYRDTNTKALIETSRLGVKAQGFRNLLLTSPPILVSCSYLVPVKRIDALIEALSLITFPVKWIHIGDGPLRAELEQLAHTKLDGKKNIEWTFAGNYTNTDLLSFYANEPVHVFINTSEAEGVPVTMMEAQSFGIPVVAPKVGGIPEIVTNENGRLFDKDSPPSDIASIIERVVSLDTTAYALLRKNAFESWEARYNADKNFPTFVAKIRAL